jgi:hypothetical protein
VTAASFAATLWRLFLFLEGFVNKVPNISGTLGVISIGSFQKTQGYYVTSMHHNIKKSVNNEKLVIWLNPLKLEKLQIPQGKKTSG